MVLNVSPRNSRKNIMFMRSFHWKSRIKRKKHTNSYNSTFSSNEFRHPRISSTPLKNPLKMGDIEQLFEVTASVWWKWNFMSWKCVGGCGNQKLYWIIYITFRWIHCSLFLISFNILHCLATRVRSSLLFQCIIRSVGS